MSPAPLHPGGSRVRASQGDPPPDLDRLWPDYLRHGYFDDEGTLRVEFVERALVDPLVKAMANAHPPLTAAQLRRFFQHCRRVETRLRSRESTWAQVRPKVMFLDAAAQDAAGKRPAKIPKLFFEFITRNIAALKAERDFLEGFVPHFEALVGFGSLYLRRESN